MFLAKKLNKGAGSPAAPADTQFNYVTMLLHGDGTNGAQNNTFLDSSTNAFSITRNGNTTQGSFSPYGSGWSNFFDGTGDYLSIADNAALDMGSSSFTIEGWFLPTADVGAGKGIFGKRANNGVVGGLLFYFSSTGLTPRLLADIGGGWGVDITASSGFTLGQWNHFATVRNSNTWTIYINGTSVGSATNSGTVADNSAAFTIMAESANASEGTTIGYISNFRVVKGSAVYTSAFTPSTTPLTAITDTSLLTCQSNRFVDNSANNFTITRNGDTSVQRFNPFGTSTAYSTSVIGGSGYFDGTGDNLIAVSADTANAMGTGDWTAEAWIYLTTGGGTPFVFDTLPTSSGSATGLRMRLNASNQLQLWQYGSAVLTSSASVTVNAWTHVALVKNSGTTTAYVNGTASNTYSDSGNYICGTNRPMIGSDGFNNGSENSFPGYISNLRLVKGTAVYTASFTPNTAPLSAITNTSLLTNFTNAAIFDNAMMNDLETVGNAQISTSVKKFGTGSMYFDGTGDYLLGNGGQGLGGDFTIEAWVYAIGFTGEARVIVDTRDAWFSTTGLNFYFNESGNLVMYVNGGDRITSSTAYSTSTWYHVALARSGSTITMYVNGTSVGTYTYSTALTDKTVIVGTATDNRNTGTAWKFYGYIDDLRITSGYARYTATFTPPTSALSDTGPY
jgi:hypothetical protein